MGVPVRDTTEHAMTSLESRCLDAFPAWLHAFADDARALAAVLTTGNSEASRRWAAVALTYLFKSLDLIPDGLEDLGYVDDAFVLRVAAREVPEDERAADASGTMTRLAGDAELVREFLGPSYAELERYVRGLESTRARERGVTEVLADPALAEELAREVREWSADYAVPAFSRDAKTLIKLRAFLETKLGAGAAG